MTCTKVGLPQGTVILCTSPDYRIVDRTGKVWYFEFHSFCGPSVLKKNGDPLKNQPPEKSPFWDAITGWIQQGQKSENGKGGKWAVWDPKIKRKN